VSKVLAIAYSCRIATDPDANTASHEEMVGAMRGEMFRAGWKGCRVTRFQQHGGKSFVEIEAGVSPFTLDYLRAFKAPPPPPVAEPAPSSQQGSLL
jgi:hypothetical protein